MDFTPDRIRINTKHQTLNTMTTYTATTVPKWQNINTGQKVSFFGAAPVPLEDFEIIQTPTIERNSNGRITYFNYAYGKILTTLAEIEEVVEKLNTKH